MKFDEARELAAQAIAPSWQPRMGTLYADTKGLEDKRFFVVHVNAEEWLVDGDMTYMLMDAPLVLVRKSDGSTTRSTYLDDPARFDRMKRVTSE